MTRNSLLIAAILAVAVSITVLLLLPAQDERVRRPASDGPAVTLPADGQAPALRAVYARPLFAPLPGEGDATAMPADAPDLAGIVGRLDQGAVALVRLADGSVRSLAPGDAVGGWRLVSLASDAAFFERGGRQLRVPIATAQPDGADQ
ncbi:hypothetical protein [Stakelama saccharophila]|uniref:Type II secretion system protein GspC N-terminal domain-containing protein n=1 Tax=Stakelama saccharophila TaxID=3075605 RepID=A0ABZ0BBI0_9SPHN|nr:hypothetical protein [Stakelama sp. W311]WNO54785.1 hypothetical protein RPR59_05940 [Stakelama sp. W311]